MTNTNWQTAAESQLGVDIITLERLGGGDFAESFAARLADGQRVFVKTHKNPPPNFFSTEAAGLRWLRETDTVAIPDVLAVSDDPPILALQWIDQSQSAAHSPTESGTSQQTEVELGRALAALHQSSWMQFGRPDGRTTGSQAVPNNKCDSWQSFYASQRLIPLAKLAHDRQALPASTIAQLESLAVRLSTLGVPAEPPSLLHGDLWAGNRLVDASGQSWLIDPATHGGHREFDIAMMQLFGGYSDTCFAAYHEAYPLAQGWEERIALHQLAPLVVHAIKFSGPYPQAVAAALRQYS